MGVFDLSDAVVELPCDCTCPGHSLRRELGHQIAELKHKNALLEAAVRSLEGDCHCAGESERGLEPAVSIFEYWAGLDLRWALTETFLRLFAAEDEVGPALAVLSEPFATALNIGYAHFCSANIPSPWE